MRLMAEVPKWLKRMCILRAKMLLNGVGQLPSSVEQMDIAIHYRRALTDDEIVGLPDAWCAIPPIHEAGHGLILEENT